MLSATGPISAIATVISVATVVGVAVWVGRKVRQFIIGASEEELYDDQLAEESSSADVRADG